MSKLSSYVVMNSTTGMTAVRKESESQMTHKKITDDMDVVHPDGKFVTTGGKVPRIRIRDLDQYCERVGKQPSELTEDEIDQFRY